MRLPTFPWNRPAPVEVAPEARTVLAMPPRPFVDTDLLGNHGLRLRMWCQVGGLLAIITGTGPDGLVEVTLQKSDGTTQMELNDQDQAVPAVRLVPAHTIERATIEMIPASRHPDVDHETHLRSFGYLSASEIA